MAELTLVPVQLRLSEGNRSKDRVKAVVQKVRHTSNSHRSLTALIYVEISVSSSVYPTFKWFFTSSSDTGSSVGGVLTVNLLLYVVDITYPLRLAQLPSRPSSQRSPSR